MRGFGAGKFAFAAIEVNTTDRMNNAYMGKTYPIIRKILSNHRVKYPVFTSVEANYGPNTYFGRRYAFIPQGEMKYVSNPSVSDLAQAKETDSTNYKWGKGWPTAPGEVVFDMPRYILVDLYRLTKEVYGWTLGDIEGRKITTYGGLAALIKKIAVKWKLKGFR